MKHNGSKPRDMQLACGLAWFSIGLGLAELLAPAAVARMAGIPQRRGLMRLFGLRELTSGLGIFAQRRPAEALWSRVLGDIMDLTVLAAALASPKARPAKVAGSIAAVAGVTALDIYCSQEVSRNPNARHGVQRVEEALTINDTAENLYNFWRQFEKLPSFMAHLKSV